MSFSFKFPSSSFPSTTPPLNSSETFSSPETVKNYSLYCRRRRGQVIELNPETLQLNLIAAEGSVSFSPVKFLYTLKNWPSCSNPKQILCNELGTLLAIQGTNGTVFVLKLTAANVVVEEIEIDTGSVGEISQIAWHPASPADHHLILLGGKSGKLAIFDLLKAKTDFEEAEYQETDGVKILQLNEAEQVIKLPGNRMDSFTGISFLSSGTFWLKFTAFLVKESGDIFALCPFLPLQFRAQRQSHLMPLKKAQNDSMNIKWLDEVLLSCEFVASAAGDTDWVLASCPPSFTHLQPHLQGPFLIQPEPMEIHHLAAYDRVVDFSVHQRSDDSNLILVIVAFGSGKIDLLAVASEISPKYQLKNSLTKSVTESDQLPIMALLESVDLGSTVAAHGNRRSVDGKIKIIDQNDRCILVSTESSVVCIDLKISQEGEDDDDWSIECNSNILIDKLKNHVICISNEKVYPGAIQLNLQDSLVSEDYFNVSSQPSGILETITKFAFPLGKMEIEGGAVQLESLVENLMKILHRLKAHRSIKSQLKLPQVDEIGATEMNEHVSEWQESLVSSAMRVGHEIALRSNELVQILRREREILLRAKTLLTAKPERLQRLMTKLHDAQNQNRKLSDRTTKILQELSKYSVYDGILIQTIREISDNLSQHPLTKKDSNEFVVLGDEGDLIQSQLLVQSEKLMKVKAQLLQVKK